MAEGDQGSPLFLFALILATLLIGSMFAISMIGLGGILLLLWEASALAAGLLWP